MSYNWDTFYNKKRNFPNAEEREYDDLPEVDLVLTKADHIPGKIGGFLMKARFKPGTLTCMLSRTKIEILNARFKLEPGFIVTDFKRSYRAVSIHYNYYPKYPVLELEPILGFHDSYAYDYAHRRAASLVHNYHALP